MCTSTSAVGYVNYCLLAGLLSTTGAFCEGMALADKSGLSQSDLLEVLSLGALANPMFALKGPSIQVGVAGLGLIVGFRS
jgi:3-hydroxyisobutyrate dehydrogenase-like beta-hydroxyacid dehydrogenase